MLAAWPRSEIIVIHVPVLHCHVLDQRYLWYMCRYWPAMASYNTDSLSMMRFIRHFCSVYSWIHVHSFIRTELFFYFIIWRNCWYIVNISRTIWAGNINQSETTKNPYHIWYDVIRKWTTSLLYLIKNSVFLPFLPNQTQISKKF